MMRTQLLLLIGLLVCRICLPQTVNDAVLERFHPLPAPVQNHLVLKKGDRLAICGDSITEQKKYSRIIEDYLTMCTPELKISVRQYGWGGEKAPGFLARMTNDCLRFNPTIATTCYGMNDHEYRPYEQRIGDTYRTNSDAIIRAFKAHKARVIQGSPGCMGKMPFWSKATNNTLEDLNLSLCNLRNVGVELAAKEKVGFADVFWPMLTEGLAAQKKYGSKYAIAGADGVHPDWAGHMVMASAFLRAFGLKGDIGTFTVDLKRNRLKASEGHKLISSKNGEFEIQSSRYPFCVCVPGSASGAGYPVCEKDDPTTDTSIRSATTLFPFFAELDRLTLVVKGGQASDYHVSWSGRRKSFTADQLARGINLAEEFPDNPFGAAFGKVDAAIAAKQAFETKQIKMLFRGDQAKTNMQAVVMDSESERSKLVDAIRAAFVPVTHTIKIEPR